MYSPLLSGVRSASVAGRGRRRRWRGGANADRHCGDPGSLVRGPVAARAGPPADHRAPMPGDDVNLFCRMLTWRRNLLMCHARQVDIVSPPEVDPAGTTQFWATVYGMLHRTWWRRHLHGTPHVATSIGGPVLRCPGSSVQPATRRRRSILMERSRHHRCAQLAARRPAPTDGCRTICRRRSTPRWRHISSQGLTRRPARQTPMMWSGSARIRM